MAFGFITNWIIKKLHEELPDTYPLYSDFDSVRYEVKPADILLIGGTDRLSDIIRIITQSPWSHAALYIGRLHDIEDKTAQEKIQQLIKVEPETQLVIEGSVNTGTVIRPISIFSTQHIRICRPRGIKFSDAQKVITYAIGEVGKDYDVQQVLDLARLLLPWRILPKTWRSSLFQKQDSKSMKQICSTMIAEAFMSVNFPILPPNVQKPEYNNPRLYVPRDFDYSPYFDIIKYPYISEQNLRATLPEN